MIWNPSLDSLTGWWASGLLHATALALLTWLLSITLLRRSRPAVMAALWTVVLVKFLIPPVLPGEYALSGWISDWVGGAEATLQEEPAEANLTPAQAASSIQPSWWRTLASRAGLAARSLQEWALPLYLTLLSWILARSLWRVFRMWRRVRRLPAAHAWLAEEVRGLAAQVGLRRQPRTLLCAEASSPYVTGLWRPCLVFSEKLTSRLGPPARQALILHELAHIRRGDLIVRSIQNLVRILLFFWPPVWWVCRRIERFSELAADHWAVSVSRVSPQLYAESLLEVVKGFGASSANPQELAFARRGEFMEERFKRILCHKDSASPRLSWMSLILLAVWASFAWAGGGADQRPQESPASGQHLVLHSAGAGAEAYFFLARKDASRPDHEADQQGDGSHSPEELLALATALHVTAGLERQSKTDFHRASQPGPGGQGDVRRDVIRIRRERLLREHPEADENGDGELSRVEALHFQLRESRELLTLTGDTTLDQRLIEELQSKLRLGQSIEVRDDHPEEGEITVTLVGDAHFDPSPGTQHRLAASPTSSERPRNFSVELKAGGKPGRIRPHARILSSVEKPSHEDPDGTGKEASNPSPSGAILHFDDASLTELQLIDEDGDGVVELKPKQAQRLQELQSYKARFGPSPGLESKEAGRLQSTGFFFSARPAGQTNAIDRKKPSN